MNGYCLITNDVEDLALDGKSYSEIGKSVQNDVMPLLLDIYDKYNVKATFFFVAEFAQQQPELLRMVQRRGHEVACHGLTHDYSHAYDVMNLEEQIKDLAAAKKILENIANQEVVSFRAPALRVNQFTAKALQIVGFCNDSSIAPQRMDIFMSLGSKNKLQWLKAPRVCYETDTDNLARIGKSGIYEFPVSSFALPYIGTLMRISGFWTKIVRYFIYLETKAQPKKSVNFLFHPSEAAEFSASKELVSNRAGNPLHHLFADVLRTKLKRRNVGLQALKLLEEEIKFWSNKNYKFLTINEYKELWIKNQ